MKVAEYHRQGLHWRVDTAPKDYQLLGEARKDGHSVAFWAKVEDGRLADVRYTSSRRCRKLMALADVAAERLRGQLYPGFRLTEADLLTLFGEERDKAKMSARAQLILKALGLAEHT